jgi:hypothetical protein
MIGANRRITYLNWNAAAVVVAACAVVGVAAAGASGACIPDLPADSAQPTVLCGDGVIELDAGETCDPGQALADASVSNCTNCQMQCPGGLLWKNNHCYQLTDTFPLPGRNGRMPQLDRSIFGQICQDGHLVTFAGEEEFQTIAGYFDASSFWVGLETAPVSPGTFVSTPSRYISVASFEPGWQPMPMCPGCYAHTATPNSPLPATPDASIDGAAEDCVVAFSGDVDAAWHQYPCSILSQAYQSPFSLLRGSFPRVICEAEPIGVQSTRCEAGICIDLVKTYPTKHYVYGTKPVTASDAQKACAALGARLVVLQSADEREQLWRELFRIPLVPSGAWGVWIGLSQATPFGRRGRPTWVWDDGTPDDGTYPSPWGVGLPTGVGTTRAFLWHATPQGPDDTLARDDQPASTLLPYVCEMVAGVGDAGSD